MKNNSIDKKKIPDNCQIMGYPAIPLKDFVKQRKK